MLFVVARAAWRQLPAKLRYKIRPVVTLVAMLIYNAQTRAAKRAGTACNRGKLVVAGFLGTSSGLGELGRNFVLLFDRIGVTPHKANISAIAVEDFPAGDEFPADVSTDGGVVIICCNPDVLLPVLVKFKKHNIAKMRVVGYWAWELEKFPAYWLDALDYVDEVWVPTHFIANALTRTVKAAGKSKVVSVVPCFKPLDDVVHPATVDPFPQLQGRPLAYFGFDVGSNVTRKNPQAVIKAFFKARDALRARNSAVRPALILKLHREVSWPEGVQALEALIGGDADVVLLKQTLTRDEMRALIARVDVVVSLHRSEGLGYTMMEAMLAGKPVIATGWSGNVDFMDSDSAILVPYTMIPVRDPQEVYNNLGASWADPDVDFAAQALERLFENPEERAALGAAGRQKIRAYCDMSQWRTTLPSSVMQLIN